MCFSILFCDKFFPTERQNWFYFEFQNVCSFIKHSWNNFFDFLASQTIKYIYQTRILVLAVLNTNTICCIQPLIRISILSHSYIESRALLLQCFVSKLTEIINTPSMIIDNECWFDYRRVDDFYLPWMIWYENLCSSDFVHVNCIEISK